MAMVVVDTNVLVDVLRGVPAAIAALERHTGDDIVVPSLVRFEILSGARPAEMATTLGLLGACLDAPADAAVADAASELARKYRRSHAGIDSIDYVVAATTALLDARLLTRNVKHFPMFPRLKAPY